MQARIMNRELIDLVTANMGEFFDAQGDIKNLSEIPEHLRKAIEVKTQRVKLKTGIKTITTYNLLNRIQLMEKIARDYRVPDRNPAYSQQALYNHIQGREEW